MMHHRTCTEKMAIEHMGQPGQRMPIAEYGRSESPFDVAERKPRPDILVVRNIMGVVESDKLARENLPVNRKSYTRQGETNKRWRP